MLMSVDKRFDPQTKFQRHPSVLVLGGSCTGKTALLHNLLHHCNVSFGVVVTPELDVNTVTPEGTFVRSTGNDFAKVPVSIMKPFLDRQQTLVRMATSSEPDEKHWKRMTKAALVLDDCFDSVCQQDQNTRFFLLNGKCYMTSLLISMSDARVLNESFRAIIDFVFMLDEPTDKGRRQLFDMYACDYFATFEEFCSVFDSVIENHGCLVIDRRAREEKLFWYVLL